MSACGSRSSRGSPVPPATQGGRFGGDRGFDVDPMRIDVETAQPGVRGTDRGLPRLPFLPRGVPRARRHRDPPARRQGPPRDPRQRLPPPLDPRPAARAVPPRSRARRLRRRAVRRGRSPATPTSCRSIPRGPPVRWRRATQGSTTPIRTAGCVGPALEIGCGVGRGTFLLAARTGDAIGLDRSVARVRRARNVQTTDEFFVRTDDASGAEGAIELSRLARDDVDFVVASTRRPPVRRSRVRDRRRAGRGRRGVVRVGRAGPRRGAARRERREASCWSEGKGAREGEARVFERLAARPVRARAGDGTRVRPLGGPAARA